MHAQPYPSTASRYLMSEVDQHFGGDQSPLNDSDADEETDPGELDLADLGLDEFADGDKLDIGSATLG
ncbi:hypothetical protein N5D61_04155 [Pseudomonas sp. GD03842]|uniref:hypothetical protein n=1 Tax=Pseudomonas sp. GD03842 TaxID=2975385 RepID=UPI0024499B7C|nr:hypothetical protein [Pseudomonas sp. GD03842]MDH0745540.1 hypothetical protein [Pseudomonas sp. GD03842]